MKEPIDVLHDKLTNSLTSDSEKMKRTWLIMLAMSSFAMGLTISQIVLEQSPKHGARYIAATVGLIGVIEFTLLVIGRRRLRRQRKALQEQRDEILSRIREGLMREHPGQEIEVTLTMMELSERMPKP